LASGEPATPRSGVISGRRGESGVRRGQVSGANEKRSVKRVSANRPQGKPPAGARD